jgi:hypothetical protein
MLTYPKILEVISPDLASHLTRFITSGLIKEADIIPILQAAMQFKHGQGEYALQTAVNQLVQLLHALEALEPSQENRTQSEETIRRLRAKNGHEAFNEVITHVILSNLFKDYIVLPLYGKGADGRIMDKVQPLEVEIKSRFPEKYKHLQQFAMLIQEALDIPPKGVRVTCRLTINQLSVTDAQVLIAEGDEFKKVMRQLNFSNLPTRLSAERKISGLHYSIGVSFEPAQRGIKDILVPDENLAELDKEDFFYFSLGAAYSDEMDGFGGLRELQVALEPNVKEILATALITECIKNSKNIPQEPRLIAIYSPHGRESFPFVKRVIDKYIASHSQTIILLCSASFAGEERMTYSISYLKPGKDLVEFMGRQSLQPNTDNQVAVPLSLQAVLAHQNKKPPR